jgi:hypothetical protein
MTHFSDEIERHALDLAWSLWAELGVDGARRKHDWQAVDLEPLIIFTAGLGDFDNRLRAGTVDWCIGNARFASAFRLRNLSEQASHVTRKAFGRYAATVSAHAKVPWPALGEPHAVLHSDHVRSPDLRRPSLIQLRLRAFVGVSARAEIIKLLLADPDRPHAASTLAEDAAYAKGSVAQALDMLTLAGMVQVQHSANRLMYRLTRPVELAQALQWLPSVFPDWWPIFKITEAIASYARTATGPAHARVAGVQALLGNIHEDLRRLGIAEPASRSAGPTSVPEIEHWAINFLSDQTGRAGTSSGGGEVSFVIHHLSFGGWLGTVIQAGREPQSLELSGRSEPRDDHYDEGTGAAQLALAMFRDVMGRGRRGGRQPAIDDAAIQVISREFSEELLRPMQPGQEATFTAAFVRRWFENRRQRFGATA